MMPLWLEVCAAVATIVSAGAVLAAVGLWMVRLRRISQVVFGWDIVGIERLDRFPWTKALVLEIRNSGVGAARLLELQLVGAQMLESMEHRARKTLGSGERFTLLVTSPDIREAWFRVMWREDASRTRATMEWRPIVSGTRLAEQHKHDADRQAYSSYWDQWRLYLKPRTVAPTMLARVALRNSRLTDRERTLWREKAPQNSSRAFGSTRVFARSKTQ